MSLIKVKQNYQVTIPFEVREQLHIELGDLFEATVQNDSIVFTPKVVVDKTSPDKAPKNLEKWERKRKSS